MDDATRLRLVDTLLRISQADYNVWSLEDTQDIEAIIAFLRSDRCPRAGDVLLREVEIGEHIDSSEECYVAHPISGSYFLRVPGILAWDAATKTVYRRIDITESEGV